MSRVVIKFNHLPRIKGQVDNKAGELISAVAFECERYIKQSFGTSPSPPGGPPGVDTGALKASIHTETVNALTRRVADAVEYGVYLEFGTVRNNHEKRPFMLPGLVWTAGQVGKIAEQMSWW